MYLFVKAVIARLEMLWVFLYEKMVSLGVYEQLREFLDCLILVCEQAQ